MRIRHDVAVCLRGSVLKLHQGGLQTMYLSTAGMYFIVNPAYVQPIADLIAQVRADIAAAKAGNCFVAYLSVPVSPRGGGHFDTNNAIATATAERLIAAFGRGLWVLNPAAYNLQSAGGTAPGGGEYMAVWGDVLAGPDGAGGDIDLVYFVGPRDVWSFFGIDGGDRIGAINHWIDQKIANDQAFKQYIETADNRRQFVRFYAIRGSAAYSKGGHDEWNIVSALNRRRATGDDIAVYFDGEPIEPGDYEDLTDAGYQVL